MVSKSDAPEEYDFYCFSSEIMQGITQARVLKST